jgi:hypothetical protein
MFGNIIKALSFILLLSSFFYLKAQDYSSEVSISHNSFYGLNDKMPFYFWANRMGQIPLSAGTLFTTQAAATGKWNSAQQHFGFTSGFRVFHSTGDIDVTRFTEAFATFSTRHIVMGGGLYADSIQQAGLSVSNGNLLSGQNAAPHFRLKLGTNGFIPIGSRNFSMAGLWEEGYMGKGNYVKNTLLHHKYLFFRWGTTERLQFTWGIDHYAQWSGISPTQGELPSKPMDYIRTVFSLPGGKNANQSDKDNVQGNQLGQYYFIFRKAYEKTTLEARIVHPFEDFSGMVFVNFPDNLYSISVDFHESKWIDKVLFEFYNTRHQSGDDIDKKTGEYKHLNGRDNYFNHSTYRSGFTHNGFIIGSPLFYPLRFSEYGIVTGVPNNRFLAFHTGITGTLPNSHLEWKLMTTLSQNAGTHSSPYKPNRRQIQSVAETRYHFRKFPAWINAAFAFDRGDLMTGESQKLGGIMFGAGWKF